MRAIKRKSENRYFAIAGLVASLITFLQFNLLQVLRVDRFQHLSLSFLLMIGLYFVLRPVKGGSLWALTGALALGFAKEVSDPSFQNWDILANFAGVGLALALILILAPGPSRRQIG